MSESTKEPYYKTITTEGYAEFRDRGSLFLGYTFPFKDPAQLKEMLQRLKEEHPKANHHCFAYRIGIDALQFRANDDGEPSSSAGKPILAQIDSRGLTDVLVVVVRYFGGTLLGVPGLIHAYKTTASLALQVTPEVTKAILQQFAIECGYDQLNDVLVLLRKNDGEKVHLEQSLFCRVTVAVPFPKRDAFYHSIRQIPSVMIEQTT
jgi:uncharacterized YigZ family protein